jgi:hypothetical protein
MTDQRVLYDRGHSSLLSCPLLPFCSVSLAATPSHAFRTPSPLPLPLPILGAPSSGASPGPSHVVTLPPCPPCPHAALQTPPLPPTHPAPRLPSPGPWTASPAAFNPQDDSKIFQPDRNVPLSTLTAEIQTDRATMEVRAPASAPPRPRHRLPALSANARGPLRPRFQDPAHLPAGSMGLKAGPATSPTTHPPTHPTVSWFPCSRF